MNEPCIIYIIGSIPYERYRTIKISNYGQPANGYLVQNLASIVLDIQKINVFAYGTKRQYDIYHFTNNKCYYQLDFDHYYELDLNTIPNFTYFQKYDTFISLVSDAIEENKRSPIVLIFDDHGTKGFFTSISYYSIYRLIMNYPENSFLVLNDSCCSGNMIDVVKAYNHIFKVKTERKLEDINLNEILSISNFMIKLSQSQNIANLDQIFSAAEETIKLIEQINIQDEETFKLILQLAKEHANDSEDQKRLNFNTLTPRNDIDAKMLTKSGFLTIQDVLNFRDVLFSLYPKTEELCFISYKRSKDAFTQKNMDLYREFLNYDKTSETDIEKFHTIISSIYLSNPDFNLSPHPNLEIVCSTDTLSYASIKVNETIKVYPGSPLISAFIKQLFMNFSGEPFSFDKIIEEISVKDGKFIHFPGRVEQKVGKRKEKQWIHLRPKHYKSGDNIFKFQPKNSFLKKIQALRMLTFMTSKTLKELAKRISPTFELESPTNNSDFIGDIVALTAIVESEKSQEISNYLCLKPPYFANQKLLKLDIITAIASTAKYVSTDPTKFAAIAANYLQEAVRQISPEKEKAIVAVMPRDAVIMALIITSKQLNEGDENDVIMMVNDSFNDDKRSLAINTIKEIKEKEEISSYAERCLLAFAKSGLEYINNVCIVEVADNFTDLIRKLFRRFTCLSILNKILNQANSEEANFIGDLILGFIDSVFQDLPSFTMLALLGVMPSETAFEILIISLYEKEKNETDSPKEFVNRAKDIIFSIKDKKNVYNNILSNVLDIETSSDGKDESSNGNDIFVENKIKRMRDHIEQEIDKSFKKLKNIFHFFEVNSLNNIERGVSYDTKPIIDRIKATIHSIKSRITINPKMMPFLNDILKTVASINNEFQTPTIIPEKGFESVVDFDYEKILMRAASELLSASNILEIYNSSIESSIKKELEANKILELTVVMNAILSRSCNIPEMASIADLINFSRFYVFGKPDLESINFDEVMALSTGTKYFLSQRDKDRERFRYEDEIEKIIETDSYYSASYFEDPNGPIIRQTRTPQNTPSNSSASSTFSSPSSSPNSNNNKSSKPKISIGLSSSSSSSSLSLSAIDEEEEEEMNEEAIEEEEMEEEEEYSFEDYGGYPDLYAISVLNVGNSTWYNDAWNVFVYRFNERVKHLGIKFDPDTHYTGYDCFMGDELMAVLKFYPITQIRKFDDKFDNFWHFVGNNLRHLKQIKEAFILAFDDTDQTVTPMYFDRRAMERG